MEQTKRIMEVVNASELQDLLCWNLTMLLNPFQVLHMVNAWLSNSAQNFGDADQIPQFFYLEHEDITHWSRVNSAHATKLPTG
jgi:hypothetical protein